MTQDIHPTDAMDAECPESFELTPGTAADRT